MSPAPEDPLFRNARREALVVTGVWLVAMTYTVGYCAWNGYGQTEPELRLVFGFPSWVFWGVVIPWVVCVVAGIWFSYFYMTDDELGQSDPMAACDSRGADGEENPGA